MLIDDIEKEINEFHERTKEWVKSAEKAEYKSNKDNKSGNK